MSNLARPIEKAATYNQLAFCSVASQPPSALLQPSKYGWRPFSLSWRILAKYVAIWRRLVKSYLAGGSALWLKRSLSSPLASI